MLAAQKAQMEIALKRLKCQKDAMLKYKEETKAALWHKLGEMVMGPWADVVDYDPPWSEWDPDPTKTAK